MKKKLLFLGCAIVNAIGFSQTVTDIDGNIYNTVIIDNQVWMAENLKVTKYNDGNLIDLVSDDNVWKSLSTSAYCFYNNDAVTNSNTYGALYNWYAVESNKLCPTGWRVANTSDWLGLSDYLGGYFGMGGKMKSTGTTHWQSPNGDATNSSGFSGLPGGKRNSDASFEDLTSTGYWWVGPESGYYNNNFRYLTYLDGTCAQHSTGKSEEGRSVRCVSENVTGLRKAQNKGNNVSVYPNPCDNVLNIVSSEATAKYFLFDLYGTIVKSGSVSSVVDVSGLADGVYLMRLIDNSGDLLTLEKVFVNH